MSRLGKNRLPVVVGIVAVAGLAGATAAGLAAQSAAATAKVAVTEVEYRITLKQRTFKVGLTTFVVANRGKVAHAFEVRGPGVAGKRLAGKIAPGTTRSLTVRLRSGSYTLFCPIHLALGMKKTIQVGSTATTSGSATTTTTSGGGGWG